MKERRIDGIDVKILKIIQDQGRIANSEIARQVDRAPSAVLERVRKLESGGYIKGFEAVLDPKALGFGVTAFTRVAVSEEVGSVHIGRQLAAVRK